MRKTQQELLAFLSQLGIPYELHRHEPLFTVAQSQALRGSIAGAHTKNLFLRDKKNGIFLLTVEEEAAVNLKTVHSLIGAAGRVSFGKPELLMETLGVLPGSVTVFGAINDVGHRVKVVIDAGLMEQSVINGHPLTNEATLSISPEGLLAFLAATGHQPLILKIAE